MRSIRAKVTTLTVCAVAVALTVAILLGFLVIRSMAETNAERTLRLLCETGQKNLNAYYDSVAQSVEIVSSFVDGDLKSLEEEELRAQVDRTRDIFAKTAKRTNGVLTYYYRIDPAVSADVKGFWYTNLDGEGFEEHEVTDITLYDTEDTSALVWFTVPKSTGRAVWLRPYITDNLDVRVLSYNVPVYCRGTFVGVVGMEIDYSTMAKLVDNIRPYTSGYAFINDSEGMIIYHPRMTQEELEDENKKETPYGMLEESALIRYTYNNVEKQAVWLPLSSGARLNVTVPLSEINEEWHNWIRELLIVSAILLVFVVLAASLLSGHLTRPLRQLTKAAEEVNAGNYDVTLEKRTNDEVGILTGAFNKLITHLKGYIRNLNDLAYGDALTAVRNLGAFNLFLQDLKKDAEEGQGLPPFAVCFFDCNDLKVINDRYGHDKGDLYLKRACATICQVFSHSPVFRIGGDEFAAILRKREYERRDELLEQFDQCCYDLRAVGREPWERIHVARGMAVYDPKQDECVEDVVRRADRLMYENKREQKAKA